MKELIDCCKAFEITNRRTTATPVSPIKEYKPPAALQEAGEQLRVTRDAVEAGS
jgi:hypothetical protein